MFQLNAIFSKADCTHQRLCAGLGNSNMKGTLRHLAARATEYQKDTRNKKRGLCSCALNYLQKL